ncbi:MAG: hypothetical protein JNL57_06610 [Bacteroidetes bacterium]|nr:hypothetical protein [Bacteroidota bacterium]
MSYLHIPRIHFSGRFFTDPSTVNNDPTHYLPDVTKPSPWQNPDGQHRFQFLDCMVTSVLGPSGYMGSDALLGANVLTTDNPAPARLVDLDVYQQAVSAIYGLQLQFGQTNGKSLTMAMDMATLNYVWFNAVLPKRAWDSADYDQDSFGGDMNAAGWFQSVLRINASDWVDTGSDALNLLKQQTLQVNGQYLVSIRIVVDGYRNVPEDAQYQTGRITGAIGPVFANEPLYNPGQRWINPRAFDANKDLWFYPSFNPAAFMVDSGRKKLVIDLANSICRQNAGGPPVDLGTLNALVTGMPDVPPVQLGNVDYSDFSYSNNSMLAELDLSDSQITDLQQGCLQLIMSRTDLGNPIVMEETYTGNHFAVEVRPIRMSGTPGATASTQVYVSCKGRKVTGKQMACVVVSVHGTTPGATVPPTNPGNTSQADGALQASLSETDENGFATLTLTVLKDPGQRTPELDGQLYFVVAYDPAVPPPDWNNPTPGMQPPLQDQMASVLVFSQYTVNTNPEWAEIQAMMEPYVKLYPAMTKQLDLSDAHSFMIFALNPPWSKVYNDNNPGPLGIVAGAIPYYMSRSVDDPRFMPISRDLSPEKILTIMHYVQILQKSQLSPKP